jgi:LPS-assembly protein
MEGAVTERRPLSDVGFEVNVSPHKYFSLAARNIYNVYTGWKVTNYDLNISDARGDNLTAGYRYTVDSIEEINLSLKAVINRYLNGTVIVRRDQLNSRTIENTVGLLYHKQCWAVGLDFTQTDTDTRYTLKLSLTGLSKLGL